MNIYQFTRDILLSTVLFFGILGLVFIVYKILVRTLKRRASMTKSKIDDFIIDLLKVPLLWLSFWLLFKVFSHNSFLADKTFFASISKANDILLIITVGWVLIKIVKAVFYYLQNRLNISTSDNLNARKSLTKMTIFEGIIIVIITVVIIALCLMSFDNVRNIGISLLTSAGIAGIVIGFAAQNSISTIFSGIQVALTQPIRLDDVVIVEGEWGRIEEITLTYVVVKIWDERRLVLPVKYFLEKPFQNWTRNTANILGTIFLYIDYNFPVDALRKHLDIILQGHSLWDERVANIQVTDSKERYKELRVLLSSKDASSNWDLRVDIREKLIDYINKEYPDSFVKYRLAK